MNIPPGIPIGIFLQKSFNFILDLLFPPQCFKCGISLSAVKNRSICSACLKQVLLVKPPFCDICGRPFHFKYDLPDCDSFQCGTCRTETLYFEKARSLGRYEGIFKDALISYKYKGRTELLVDIMENCFKTKNSYFFSLPGREEEMFVDVDFILYVPLNKQKLFTRGFDQAFLIAREISKIYNIPLRVDSLFKRKNTPPQAGQKKKIRIKNLNDAFAVRNAKSMKGKTVLLVDDVITTGATVNECSKVLKRSGVSRVEVFTLARAV